MRRLIACACLVMLAPSCRRLPSVRQSEPMLEVGQLALSFPKPDEGHLSFELAVPERVTRVNIRWVLVLGTHRLAEGVVLAPATKIDAAGRRLVHLEVPLSFRHVAWRDGATSLPVGLSGELQQLGSDARWLFRTHRELLVSGAPVLEELGDSNTSF